MIAATLKNGVCFQYAYEGGTGRCARTWGPKGLHELELQVDRQARTTTIVSEEPKVYTWNDEGLVVREDSLGGERLLERAYDEDAFLIAESNGRGEGRQIWYDDRGNRIRIVDAAGNVTAWEYERDQPVREIAPGGLVTHRAYDSRGALVGISYPTGLAYSLSYDDRGRLTAIHGAGGPVLLLEHDSAHNVVAETDARGGRTLYTYDAMGRPVSAPIRSGTRRGFRTIASAASSPSATPTGRRRARPTIRSATSPATWTRSAR